MRRTVVRAGTAVLAACVLTIVSALPAAAHEQRKVGAYQFTVGWQNEPTYVGELNAVQLFLHDANGNPVDDLGNPPSLQVTASTGNKTSSPLTLKASFDPDTSLGTHSEFHASIIPTTPGIYKFHFTGSINGQKVDETFTSSDSTFDNVVEPTAVEFPIQEPSAPDLATSISRLGPRVDAAASAAKSAHDKSSTATTLAIVALVVAVVLGGASLTVAVMARQRRS
ncbi:MAG TPA: hypothetical protein VLL25_18895 [Acidimicrobiales bacterium]|nr:hypothetical protein [Acidimicrobiales bacterium]